MIDRRETMTKLRSAANQLRIAMKAIAEADPEFTKVFGTVVQNETGFDQMIIDLESLAGLAMMEE